MPRALLQVFMLDVDRVVDEGLLAELLNTGHSRIPVYRNNRWAKPSCSRQQECKNQCLWDEETLHVRACFVCEGMGSTAKMR